MQIPAGLQASRREASEGGKEMEVGREKVIARIVLQINSIFRCVEISSTQIHRWCCSSGLHQRKHISLCLKVSEQSKKATGDKQVSQAWAGGLFIVQCCPVSILWSVSTRWSLFWGWSFGYSKHAGAWLESLVCFLVVGSWPQPVLLGTDP